MKNSIRLYVIVSVFFRISLAITKVKEIKNAPRRAIEFPKTLSAPMDNSDAWIIIAPTRASARPRYVKRVLGFF